MNHRFAGPLALVEIVAILGKTACVQDTAAGALARPGGFPQIINARPDEVANNIIVNGVELPKLFRADHGGSVAKSGGVAAEIEAVSEVIAPHSTHGDILRADE